MITILTNNISIFILGNCAKLKNDNVDSGQQPLIKIQPHQGLNPCLERNFASNNISKVDSSHFVHGSKKDKPKPRPQASAQAAANPILNETMAIPRHHFVHPIPYLQNDIQSTSSTSKRTKNLNLKANASYTTPSFKKGGF